MAISSAARSVALSLLAFLAAACSTYVPFDSSADLKTKFAGALGEQASTVEVPFALSPELEQWLTEHMKPAPDEQARVDAVLAFIFDELNLHYSLTPTYDAMGTYAAHQGNCLSFVNLFVVAVVGPLLGVWLRRRNATRPAFAARDRGAVIALGVTCALLLAGGIAHQPAVRGEAEDLRAQARAARSWFAHREPEGLRRASGAMTTWKAGEDLYRTCVPDARADREVCVYVATDQSPPAVTRDASGEPNSRLAGPYGDIVVVR